MDPKHNDHQHYLCDKILCHRGIGGGPPLTILEQFSVGKVLNIVRTISSGSSQVKIAAGIKNLFIAQTINFYSEIFL